MIALLLAVSLAYGPGGNGVGTATPVYGRPIRVIDSLIGTLREDRRPVWRNIRDLALDQWGLDFTVERGTAPYAWTDENINVGLAITDIVPGAIIVVRDYSSSCQTMGGWDPNQLGGIVIMCPWKPWWHPYYRQQAAGAFGHEIGHALGFGHGGTGIMSGSTEWPDATDRTLADAYY